MKGSNAVFEEQSRSMLGFLGMGGGFPGRGSLGATGGGSGWVWACNVVRLHPPMTEEDRQNADMIGQKNSR